MAYPFTAEPVVRTFDMVGLINGGMAQRGFHWLKGPVWPPDVCDEVCEIALLDAGYCLDAPSEVPAGACFGVDMSPSLPFAAPVQHSLARDA